MKRATAFFLVLCVLMMSVPLMTTAADVAPRRETILRVADPSTMNDWMRYFGEQFLSTEYAGRVWTDKSVLTDASAFADVGITMNDDNGFLVALSAIASNVSINGLTNVPTDTMLVLDVSKANDAATAESFLRSINRAIEELQNSNGYNRVGVVVYDGARSSDASCVLMPLGRYNCGSDRAYPYVKPVFRNGAIASVEVNVDVTNEAGAPVLATHIVSDATGAYMQAGILNAMNELLQADPIVSADAAYFAGKTRLPVVVLTAGSAPTAATAQYTTLTAADMGGNSSDRRDGAQIDFLTQLTAAYAKVRIDEHYGDTDPLFYTIGLNDAISPDVMDPASDTDRAVDGYWNLLLNDGSVSLTVGTDADTYTVSKTTVAAKGQATLFPSNKSEKYYADETFVVDGAADCSRVIEALLKSVDVRSHYHPTLVHDNEDLSGYISFVDKIGEYMSVTDIKGILIDNTLFSGALLSKNFVTGGGDLGTYTDPTALGDELVRSVRARLGVDGDTARDLVGLAYEYGQLRYVSDTQFSNYIGWYANAAGEYLGFWYDGITTMPDPNDPSLTDETRPAYIIRSYGFLGAVDEKHGVDETDLMYATVQVRENIETGEESVAFAIPAALIPIVTYDVTLDDHGEPEHFEIGGADHPIRLVYEVALDDGIDSLTVTDTVKDGYAHKNADGTYDFYTNCFETDGSVGYGKVNTYSYFIPSYENERYYYTENTAVYADTDGTVHRGALDVNGIYYRANDVYSREDGLSVKTVYEQISSASLAKAIQNEDGSWYIPVNTVHTMLEPHIVYKTANPTESLGFAANPFVDTQYTYYVGMTLGNNGRLTLVPETGLKLTKTIDGEVTDEVFAFRVTRTDIDRDNAAYDVVTIDRNGKRTVGTIVFVDSTATVSVKSGDTVYILDMQEGATYRVSEVSHTRYKLVSLNGQQTDAVNVTIRSHELTTVHAVNALRGTGDLIITNEIAHSFGALYEIPPLNFTIRVSFGESLAGQSVVIESTGANALRVITLDENGSYVFAVDHDEQMKFFGLPEGAVATVEAVESPDGFAPQYKADGTAGNTVTIAENKTASVVVTNVYHAAPVSDVNIRIDGQKRLIGRENDAWTSDDVYTFELQRYGQNGWETIATASVDQHQTSFDFRNVLAAEVFDNPGAYSYQVIETAGTVDGIVYDRTLHTFTVVVRDVHMDGDLNIVDVHSNVGDIVDGNETDGWVVSTEFVNVYDEDGAAQVTIDVETVLKNPTNSTLASAEGFSFGLFADGETYPDFVSVTTDAVGETRVIATLRECGTYRYTLKEIIPQYRVTGMTYSDETYTVIIMVTADDQGMLHAQTTIVSARGETIAGAPIFTNTYAPEAAAWMPRVSVELDGRTLRDGEFSFEVRNADAVLMRGVNDENGAVMFERALTLETVGEYYYTVVQTAGTLGGVTYDETVFEYHVTVRDGGDGRLVAAYHVVNVVGDDTVFTNVYQAAPTDLVVRGTKTLIG
ncbi:MAG: hypothetical protein IKV35_03295, partial [Clostridia bacterium]|nr:hypothetical protein [Clostridia bacterium]